MQLPKKITPDNIVDGLVQIVYKSELPYDVLIGAIFNSLDDTYIYEQKLPNLPLQQINEDESKGVIIRHVNNTAFHNDKIRIILQPNSFLFTSLNLYLGWVIFKEEIIKFINAVHESSKISVFIRIGVRFINQYSERDLSEIVNFNITFPLPYLQSNTFTFQSEFKDETHKIILNLSSNAFIPAPPLSQPSKKFSVFDIDVIDDLQEIKDYNQLLDRLESCHLKEKQIFYSFLNQKFLDTLKVEY